MPSPCQCGTAHHWEEAKKHGDKAKQVSNQEVARRMEQVEQLTGTTQKKEETYQTEETQKKEDEDEATVHVDGANLD